MDPALKDSNKMNSGRLDPAILQPHQHLVAMLSEFAASVRASQPSSAQPGRWARAATQLEQELSQLGSVDALGQFAAACASSDKATLSSVARRLTQLARAQDGLRLDQSTKTLLKDLADQRRLVVFAAWQLLQALESSASAPVAAEAK